MTVMGHALLTLEQSSLAALRCGKAEVGVAAAVEAASSCGPGDRANMDFRPDPTAPVPEDRRDAMAPATIPNPMNAEPLS